jgi:hypothetical protein
MTRLLADHIFCILPALEFRFEPHIHHLVKNKKASRGVKERRSLGIRQLIGRMPNPKWIRTQEYQFSGFML